jgi:mxaK protein
MEADSMSGAKLKTSRQYLRHIPQLLLILMGVLLLAALYFFNQWHRLSSNNNAYADKRLLKQQLPDNNPLLALQYAYLLSKQKQTVTSIKQLIHALTLAEAAEDTNLRAEAKFAVGNLYFDLSGISTEALAGKSHQQAVAQIELAREAYKSALRLKPDMYDARFNLELLDRLSPERRTQAWKAETDGVTLQPFKRNGTAMMKDNKRRGLP